MFKAKFGNVLGFFCTLPSLCSKAPCWMGRGGTPIEEDDVIVVGRTEHEQFFQIQPRKVMTSTEM